MNRSSRISVVCITALLFNFIFYINPIKADNTIDKPDIWLEAAEDINDAPGYENSEEHIRNWVIDVGFIGGVSPDYEGSNDYEFGMGPNFSITWKNLIWFKGKSLGANLLKRDGWTVGPLIAKSSGRDEDDNDKLKGLNDVDGGMDIGGFAKYKKKHFRFELDMRQDTGSGNEGAIVKLSAGLRTPFAKPWIQTMLHTTWASDNYMESFFGISKKESARSGLRKFNADSGIKDIGVALTSGVRFWRNWKIGVGLQYKRLVGDAANSPIVDDKNQFLAGMSVVYTWRSKKLKKGL